MATKSAEDAKTVTIVGGGLVGALEACYMAKRNYNVHLYEMREDIRTLEVVRGRSINLALSVRGREALKRVGLGLEEEMVKQGIPMHARMVHDREGTRRAIPYGKKDQYIMSVDRRHLNEILLTAAEKFPNVTLHFDHKVVDCNFDTSTVKFKRSDGNVVSVTSDLIIGCDGAFSQIRQQMMKKTLFDYEQIFIPHGYMELNMPPTKDDQFAMEINYLHIWARNEFMMIALPNLDKSYTVTLFTTFDMFKTLKTPEDVMNFFKEHFADSIPLMGALLHSNLDKSYTVTLFTTFDMFKTLKTPEDVMTFFKEHFADSIPLMGALLHSNLDKSYTVTLFTTFDMFKTLKTPEDVMTFFKEHFADSIPLMGAKYLGEYVSSNKALPMVTVKCSPYHVKDKIVIMGDAAHAMVPFYGQGMNCGMEDCIVLDDMLNKHNDDIGAALAAYTEHRNVDAKAMVDLAFYNYIEMRQSVNSKLFLMRKKLDNFIYWLFPSAWMPLYTSVSFSRTRYHQCIKNKQWQDQVIRAAVYYGIPVAAVGGFLAYRYLPLPDVVDIPDKLTKLVQHIRPTWL